MVGVPVERLEVRFLEEVAVAPHEGVVGVAELLARGGDLRVGRVLELRAVDRADRVAHAEHPLDAPGRGGGELRRRVVVAVADDD